MDCIGGGSACWSVCAVNIEELEKVLESLLWDSGGLDSEHAKPLLYNIFNSLVDTFEL